MIGPRDQEALDAFQRAKKFHVATTATVAEYDTEQGVFDIFAAVLMQVRGRVEHKAGGQYREVALKEVFTEEPLASAQAVFPAAYLESIVKTELDAQTDVPVRDAKGDDVLTDEYALWKFGEDTGEANVKIFTTTEVEAKALAHAVRETLAGNLDTFVGAVLPMPVRSLPEPFREAFPIEKSPSCHLTLRDSRGRPEPGAEAGMWTVDIEFAWRATRFTARPRIADFRPFVTVTEP